MVTHFIYFIEESVDHIVLDLQLGKLSLVGLVLVVGLRNELGDTVLEQISD